MSPTLRQFLAVVISGVIIWFTLRPGYLFLTPWWGFALLLGVVYLVVDATLEVIYRKVTKSP